MQANIKNLMQAVQLSAKAKNNSFCDWSDENQIAVDSTSPATIMDIHGIVGAFSNNSRHAVLCEWGYTTIFLDEIDFNEEVNVGELENYLPYGWVEKETWE